MSAASNEGRNVYVVTGAAGFIASYLTGFLNRQGIGEVVLVDDFSRPNKVNNYKDKTYLALVDRDSFFTWFAENGTRIKGVFHLGARTDTTEMDYEVHKRLNLDYSIEVWKLCVQFSVPLVYASSAATYGNGELGYSDSHDIVSQLQPLNPYGISKNEFDKWVLAQTTTPPFWAGLKFFNVFGPNEYHKGRMASVIFHAYNTIKRGEKVRLFRSHNPKYKDGEQIRDFIYVEDVARICYWLMEQQPTSGLYNTGTGEARTFNDLVYAIYAALDMKPEIEYIDTPLDIRDKYQYFTEADMSKLRAAGYSAAFHSLEEGVRDYVVNYLTEGKYY